MAKATKTKTTIKATVQDILSKHEDWNAEKVVEKIKTQFPKSKFNKQHVSWYKHNMKKEKVST